MLDLKLHLVRSVLFQIDESGVVVDEVMFTELRGVLDGEGRRFLLMI